MLVRKILPAEVETVVAMFNDSDVDATNDVFVSIVSAKELKVPVVPFVDEVFRVLDVVLVFNKVENSFEVDADEDADDGVYIDIDEDVGKNVGIGVVV